MEIDNVQPYFMMRKDLAAAKYIEIANTPRVRITPFDKLLLAHMIDRYNFFKGNGNDYYDNQDNIAEELGTTTRTISTNISKLASVGLIKISKKKMQGFVESNSYEVFDPICQGKVITGFKRLPGKKPSLKSDIPAPQKSKPSSSASKKGKNFSSWEEFDDAPF